jgi:hypothetical protein
MSTGPDVSAAVEGYLQLARWWLQAWGSHATGVAARAGSGSYGSAEAAADLAECTRLASESLFLLVNETVDAAAVLSGGHREPHIVDSIEFPAPVPADASAAPKPWSLALAGPLVAALGGTTIPTSSVSFDPEELGPSDARFTLRVDATGHAGVTYLGEVAVVAANGATLDPVQVWVAVP